MVERKENNVFNIPGQMVIRVCLRFRGSAG